MTTDWPDDDPWLNLPANFDGAGSDLEKDVLRIETIEGVEPLGNQFGVWPPKTVPDALRETLFGQQEPTKAEIEHYGSANAVPPMQTYAILDAAKVFGLPEILGASRLEHRCLFKGGAYEELKNVAPWIVRLEEDSDFTVKLFTEGKPPWLMWNKDPGIYIRSRAGLEVLWKHFRKFTRVQDEHDKWTYFRFWEPEVARVHFDYISELDGTWSEWFYDRSGERVHSCISVKKNGTVYIFTSPEISSERPSRNFRMTNAEVDKFRIRRFENSVEDLALRLSKYAPDKSKSEAYDLVKNVMNRFYAFRFRSKASFFTLAWCELKYGPMFERRLEPSVWELVSNGSRDEDLRMNDIRNALEQGTGGMS